MAENNEIKSLTLAEVSTLASHFNLQVGGLRAVNKEVNAAFNATITPAERKVLTSAPLAFHKPHAIAAAEVNTSVLFRAGAVQTALVAWENALKSNDNVGTQLESAATLFRAANAPLMSALCGRE